MGEEPFSISGVISKALAILFFVLVLPFIVLLLFPQPTVNVMVVYFGLALLFAFVWFFGAILRVLLFGKREKQSYAADIFKLGKEQQRSFSDFELINGETILVPPTPVYLPDINVIMGAYRYVAVTDKRITIGFVRGSERSWGNLATKEILGKMNIWRKDVQIPESMHKEDFTDRFPFTLPTHWIADWDSRMISVQTSKDEVGDFLELRFTRRKSESTLRLYTPQASSIAKILS